MPEKMVPITFVDVVDLYLREQAGKLGQSELARRIGTQRQGINAIMNRRQGRRFTLEHLARFATASNMLASTLGAELAQMAWRIEGEMVDAKRTAMPPQLPATPSRGDDVIDVLSRVLDELKKQRH
jgi:transcriptional regulator with XRE-family HTH domain